VYCVHWPGEIPEAVVVAGGGLTVGLAGLEVAVADVGSTVGLAGLEVVVAGVVVPVVVVPFEDVAVVVAVVVVPFEDVAVPN